MRERRGWLESGLSSINIYRNNMTGLQKVFFGIGLAAILGLGVLVYQQLKTPVAVAPVTSTVEQGSRSDAMKSGTKMAPLVPVPATPDAVADDITKEIDEDNSMLNDETDGETSQIETDGDAVTDFNTIYDETK